MLDTEIRQVIDRYLEVSELSTATTQAPQRIDYQAMVRISAAITELAG